MLALAQQNAREARVPNVHFLNGVIERIPLAADSVDVVISNCAKAEYEAGLEEAGFEQISVDFTHEVGDGMHGAIVKSVKTEAPFPVH